MKKAMMLLGVLFLFAAPGMAQNLKTNDAGVQNIIKRAVAKATMEASEEWKWEEILGLAQLDPSVVDVYTNFYKSEFFLSYENYEAVCYEEDTKTFIYESTWLKSSLRVSIRGDIEGLSEAEVKRAIEEGKCKSFDKFKSAIPLAERKAKLQPLQKKREQALQPSKIQQVQNELQRIKQQIENEPIEEKVARQKRAHKAMLIRLSMANGQGVPLKVAEQLVLGFGITNLPNPAVWSKVYYNPAKKIIWLSYYEIQGDRGSGVPLYLAIVPLKVVLDIDNGKYTKGECQQSFPAEYAYYKYNFPDNINDYMLVYDRGRDVNNGSIVKSLDPASQLVNQYKNLLIKGKMLLEEMNKEQEQLMKQQEQEEESKKKLAKQERAHKAMLLSLSMANGAGLSLESTIDLVKAFGVDGYYESWTRVLYAPSKRSLWVYYNKNSWVKIDFDKETADVKYTYSGMDEYYEIPKNFYDYMVVYDKSVSGGVYRTAKSLDPVSKISDQYKKLKIATNMLLEEINKE